MRRDPRGNPVATASAAALDASERALWRMMSFYGTPIADLDAAIAADPAWRLPRLMKAGFLLSLTEPALAGDAAALLHETAAAPGPLDDRERAHLVALQRLAAGDWLGASDAWGALLAAHPRDALALQWAHLFDFYRGDSAQLRDRAGAAAAAWPDDDPLHPYVLALHAFGLEESGQYDAAEAAGRRALAGDPRVPWAIHAVAHVMEMQGRHEEGARWLDALRRQWGVRRGAGHDHDLNGFAGHLGWHEALFALETLDVVAALRIYDIYLDAPSLEITLQRVDAASLLWRIALVGGDVGHRWRELLAGWRLDAASAGQSIFNDAHATLALIGAEEMARADEWVALALANAERNGGWNGDVSGSVGAPLLRGLLAFAAGRYDAAVELIAPLRERLAPIGGSHAQRDVVNQTLLAAAARGGLRQAGAALIDERRRAKPTTPLSEHWARKLAASARR